MMEIFGYSIYLIVLSLAGTVMVVWGSQTRGTWSQNIAIVGGIVWLLSVVLSFLQKGIVSGLVFTFATFALGAILSNFFPKKI